MSNAGMATFRSGPERVRNVANPDSPPFQGISASELRRIINARSVRRRHFSAEMFADPAWEILLELYAACLEQHRHTVGGLCAKVDVPMTTVLRWLSCLQEQDLIERRNDPLDSRRVFVELSQTGEVTMYAYFQGISLVPASNLITI
ncbi:MAG TPA: MarR family winged helix-turn-helix transcriptional regulator [Sphingomicrobium sp.]|nr:MarR family winged helix-turn-helix transcriptional regulator [Sphingomicrobium sp.]